MHQTRLIIAKRTLIPFPKDELVRDYSSRSSLVDKENRNIISSEFLGIQLEMDWFSLNISGMSIAEWRIRWDETLPVLNDLARFAGDKSSRRAPNALHAICTSNSLPLPRGPARSTPLCGGKFRWTFCEPILRQRIEYHVEDWFTKRKDNLKNNKLLTIE